MIEWIDVSVKPEKNHVQILLGWKNQPDEKRAVNMGRYDFGTDKFLNVWGHRDSFFTSPHPTHYAYINLPKESE